MNKAQLQHSVTSSNNGCQPEDKCCIYYMGMKTNQVQLDLNIFAFCDFQELIVARHPKCEDMQTTCTSSGSTGSLHIFTFRMTCYTV